MTSGANEAGVISTLGAGEMGHNSLINAQNGGVPSLISYPARPIQGGRLDRAPKKTGLWYAQPKYNGWMAVVHCPSGTMWNRHWGGCPTNWRQPWGRLCPSSAWRITLTQFAVLFCP